MKTVCYDGAIITTEYDHNTGYIESWLRVPNDNFDGGFLIQERLDYEVAGPWGEALEDLGAYAVGDAYYDWGLSDECDQREAELHQGVVVTYLETNDLTRLPATKKVARV